MKFNIVGTQLLLALFLGFGSSLVYALKVGDTVTERNISLSILNEKGAEVSGVLLDEKREQDFLVLDFMSIDCGICVENLPAIMKLSKSLATNSKFVTVSVDRNTERVRDFFKQDTDSNLLGIPVAYDNQRKATRIFGLRGTPTLFILDRDFEVVYKHVGLLRAEDLENIQSLLNP